MKLIQLWQNIQPLIKSKIGQTSYETWFSTLYVQEKSDRKLLIEAPDEFFKNWIVEHYQSLLDEILSQNSAEKIDIEFAVNPTILKADTEIPLLKFLVPSS